MKLDVLEKIDLGPLGGLSGPILDLAPKGQDFPGDEARFGQGQSREELA